LKLKRMFCLCIRQVKELVADLKGRLSIFILSPYAPDLNLDKWVWSYIRQTGTARSPLKKGESLWERAIIDLELITEYSTNTLSIEV
ncbi:MAG: hypothetical protein KAG66_03650, partial [Methylococcales bacterium]|nr:hypothetical protein [Methylococcales bacterium]